MPFEFEKKLYMIYGFNPYRVLEVNTDTGVCTEITNDSHAVTWNYGEVRGGTPAIDYNESEFIHFFHSSKDFTFPSGLTKKVYFAGAMTFSKSIPFKPKRMIEHPIMDSSYYDQENPGLFIFPTGIIKEDKYFHLFMGKNDSHMIRSKIYFDTLETYLKDIDF